MNRIKKTVNQLLEIKGYRFKKWGQFVAFIEGGDLTWEGDKKKGGEIKNNKGKVVGHYFIEPNKDIQAYL